MGNSSSSQRKKKSHPHSNRRSQIQYLGDHYPFGDEEIIRLYRCHAFLRRARHVRKSFLSDWAVFATTLPPEEDDENYKTSYTNSTGVMVNGHAAGAVADADTHYQNQQQYQREVLASARLKRAKLLNFVEGRILPSGFGRRFERAVFLLRRDVVDYRSSSMTTDSPSVTPINHTKLFYIPGRGGGDGNVHDKNGRGRRGGSRGCCGGGGGGSCKSKGCCDAGGSESDVTSGDDDDGGGGSHGAHHGGSVEVEEKNGLLQLVHGAPSSSSSDDDRDIDPDRFTEDLSFMRLEKFLQGAAECGRRGARPALTVLFKCCSRNSRGGYTSDMLVGGGGGGGGFTYAGANGHEDASLRASWAGFETNDPGSIMANAGEVLDLGYSLSLAAAYLSAAGSKRKGNGQEGEEEVDPNNYIPEDGTSNAAMEALSTSLLEYAAKRKAQQQYGMNMYSMPASSLPTPYYGMARNNDIYDTDDDDRPRQNSESSVNTFSSDGGLGGMITLDVFLEWAESTAPMLSASLGTFLHYILFPDRPYPPSRTPFVFPELKGQHSAFFTSPSSPLLFTFACMSPSLGGTWHRLYTSELDGLSFNRLLNSLLGYGGPTLLIIRSTKGDVFGAFTASTWKESKDFYGNSDCFLYQLLPNSAVYRPSGNGTNFMYCNSEARSRGYDGRPHGIGFGGNTDKPRLFIAESFDGCVASSQDITFERGLLLSRSKDGGMERFFDIDALEVWGVGGDEIVAGALGARHKQREIVEANIRKARKVDKASFLEDFNSGLIESKAFKHRDQVRGRVDCHIDDRDAKNYVYEK